MTHLFQPQFLYHYITANEIETLKQHCVIRPPKVDNVDIPISCIWFTTTTNLTSEDSIDFLFKGKRFQKAKNMQGKLLDIARIKIAYSTLLIPIDYYNLLVYCNEKSTLKYWGPSIKDEKNNRVYYYASILPIHNNNWLSFQYFDGKRWKEVKGWRQLTELSH